MTITLVNTSGSQLSLDIPLNSGRAIRGKLGVGGSMNVSTMATLQELHANPVLRALVAAGSLSLATATDSGDAGMMMDSQLISALQTTAADISSEVILGTAAFSGYVVAEAQVGAIPADGESTVIQLKKNGSNFGATLTFDEDTSPAARTVLTFNLGAGMVTKGDYLGWTVEYTAGNSPTPIVNTALRMNILKV